MIRELFLGHWMRVNGKVLGVRDVPLQGTAAVGKVSILLPPFFDESSSNV
jgi:hypothetical protein